MFAYTLTGWLVTEALPMGGVVSPALGWAVSLIAVLMLLLLALLAVDNGRPVLARRPASLSRGRHGGQRQAATFRVARCASVR